MMSDSKVQVAGADGSGEMFDGIAERYDLLNRIMSFGMDRSWRDAQIRALELGEQPSKVLDLATGTADVAIAVAEQVPGAQVVGLDPSMGMLGIGERKVKSSGLEERVDLVFGDAQDLSFEADSFDGITMSFGIRNVPDRAKALQEMARVLKPGGRVVILELSEPRNGLLAFFARLHVRFVVPVMGAIISGKNEYGYLQKSIEAFPRPEAFEALMKKSGLEPLRRRSFSFGACEMYIATKGGAGS